MEEIARRLRVALAAANIHEQAHRDVSRALRQHGLLANVGGSVEKNSEEEALIDCLLRDDLSPAITQQVLELLLEHDLQPGYYAQKNAQFFVAYSRSMSECWRPPA